VVVPTAVADVGVRIAAVGILELVDTAAAAVALGMAGGIVADVAAVEFHRETAGQGMVVGVEVVVHVAVGIVLEVVADNMDTVVVKEAAVAAVELLEEIQTEEVVVAPHNRPGLQQEVGLQKTGEEEMQTVDGVVAGPAGERKEPATP
jgi:hypothetical protein